MTISEKEAEREAEREGIANIIGYLHVYTVGNGDNIGPEENVIREIDFACLAEDLYVQLPKIERYTISKKQLDELADFGYKCTDEIAKIETTAQSETDKIRELIFKLGKTCSTLSQITEKIQGIERAIRQNENKAENKAYFF